jgi:signal transduction histidine kinase
MMADVVRAGSPDPITAADLRRVALATAIVSGSVVALLAIIWALTTRGRFWPIWPALALGLVTGIVAWVAWVWSDPPARTRVSLGVTLTAGIYACLVVGLTAVWALTGGYFWPVWVVLALGVVLGVHALVASAVRPAQLEQRIETLTTTRANAIDAQEAELRRIERDLHDGAQARLVALGMTIGLAEQRLDTDPEGARRLLGEAKGGAHDALEELRDLARGIRPPVLQDRGLVAAIGELAARSPIDVRVDAAVADLPPAIESAAYFVVAEALANAAKHAAPTRVDVRLRQSVVLLVVEVRDDGRGGADPDGTGLRGLRARVEALDGRFLLTSPVGGPTTVRGELPCGS